MCQLQVIVKVLCLLFLVAGLPASLAEEFPQCTGVNVDTFVMTIDDCASYIYCNGEDSFRDSCPDQTYFDAKAQECAFDDEGICLRSRDNTASTAATDVAVDDEDESNMEVQQLEAATTAAAPAATVAPTGPQIGDRPHCDTAADGFYPHRERCEYYYSCLGGFLSIVRCPYRHGWDYAAGLCKPLAQAKCLSL
ncbi:hypothetical protein KR222_010141 [Zaprionus bogoriensis]|nr:hypothetical protein KR222_010141 [Zaprionus bogoriensis]